MRMDGARLEIQRLRRKLAERDFTSSAPLFDEDGLPMWGGGEPLTTEGYERALDGAIPDADLSDEELATRTRLSPFREVFSRLEETEKGETVT